MEKVIAARVLLTCLTIFQADLAAAQGEVMAVAVDPVESNVLYLGTFANGIHKSTDAGVSWTALTQGITRDTIWGPTIAVDPTDTSVVYAGVGSRVYKSTNGGGNWTETLVSSTGAFFSLSLDQEDLETLYATTDAGIYKSINRAESWEWVNFPPYWDLVLALAIARDGEGNRQVYAGLQRRGILRSSDEKNWRYDDGYDCVTAFVFAVDRERNIPYVGACAMRADRMHRNREVESFLFRRESCSADAFRGTLTMLTWEDFSPP